MVELAFTPTTKTARCWTLAAASPSLPDMQAASVACEVYGHMGEAGVRGQHAVGHANDGVGRRVELIERLQRGIGVDALGVLVERKGPLHLRNLRVDAGVVGVVPGEAPGQQRGQAEDNLSNVIGLQAAAAAADDNLGRRGRRRTGTGRRGREGAGSARDYGSPASAARPPFCGSSR